jgi:hypothetical protein
MTLRQYLTKLNYRSTPLTPKFSTVFKIVLIALISIVSIRFVTSALAATSSPLLDFKDSMHVPSLGKWLGIDGRDTDIFGVFDLAVSVESISPELISGNIPKDGRFFVSAPGGIIGATNNLIGQLYNQPISGVEYLADMKNEFLGIKTVNAQGVGFKGLQPVLPIWRAFRNVVYILSSILFIVIGIMIMLRVKISPQAVISLQSAIPQLVTALILVTFSYAIAGLIIDLSIFIMGAVLALLFQSQGKGLGDNLFLSTLQTNVPILKNVVNWYSFNNLASGNLITVISLLIVPSVVTTLLGALISAIVGFLIASPLLIAGPVGAVGAAATAALFGSAGAILVVLVLIVMIFIWLFQFLLGLFKCYATLLFKIILAPLEIGIGAFPNSKIGFNTWFLDVVANIAVFPISLLFLVISNVIIMNIMWGGFTGALSGLLKLDPNSIGMWTPALLGGSITEFGLSPIGGIAAMAIGVSTLMLLAKLPDMIPQYIFMLKPSDWGKAIGETLSPSLIADNLHRYTGFNDDIKRIFPKRQTTAEPEANDTPAKQTATTGRKQAFSGEPETGGVNTTPPNDNGMAD